YIFVTQTLTAEHPFFPRELFRDRNFVSCLAFSMMVGGVLFASTALLPVFMQSLMGWSALQSGGATLPRGGGAVASCAVAPFLIGRIGLRGTILLGWGLSVLALWQMGHFDLAMTMQPIRV